MPDDNRRCPHCGSDRIKGERDHGYTICQGCGWYTKQGGPNEPVDWEEIHE